MCFCTHFDRSYFRGGGLGWSRIYLVCDDAYGSWHSYFSPTNHLVVLERQASQLLADSLRIGMVLVAFIGSSELRLDVTYAVFASSLASLAGHLLLFYVHFDEHKRRLA